jgi:hypothetical protein
VISTTSQRISLDADGSAFPGPLARIGPNHLITSDPELFRHILGVRSTYQRGVWFDCLRLNPFHANLITERDRKKHNALRAQLTAGVSPCVA